MHHRIGVADALFSKVQQRVLALLFGQPERQYQSAELIRLAASGTGAVHRCVTDLVSCGLVTVTAIGNQRHYRANMESPVFEALRMLLVRTVALAEPLRSALAPLHDQISESFVFGSVAKGSERASSDVDLLVVSDSLNYSTLYESLTPVEAQLGRRVNPVLLTLKQWRHRLARDESFAARIRRGEVIVIQEAPGGAGRT